MAFLEHGVDFKVEATDVFAPSAQLLAANPFGRVPVLLLKDGTPITDSNAMLTLLYQVTPESKWVPKSAEDRLRCAKVTGLALGLCEMAVVHFLEGVHAQPDQAFRAEIVEGFKATLAQLEREWSGESVVKSGLTQADIDLAVALGYLNLRWPMDTQPAGGWQKGCPKLAAFLATMEKRPSFAGTMPPPA